LYGYAPSNGKGQVSREALSFAAPRNPPGRSEIQLGN